MNRPFKRTPYLIFGSPLIADADIQEVVDTLRSGWIGTGPKVLEFEKRFGALIGCSYAAAVSSCTAALELALEIGGIGPGDEVITTPLTFAATANVIVHRGATPVFADIDRTTANISPVEIQKRITSKTRAIIPVHLAGRPCDMDEIMTLAREHRLLVVEDAAHAIEAYYRGRKIGSIGDFGAFSFYPTKSLTTGEGGMLTTNRADWAERAKILCQHGISVDAWRRYSEDGRRHYETIAAGYKQNMTDLQAALGLHQLDRLRENLERREAIWRFYDGALAGLPGVVTPADAVEPGTVHARHLYTVMIEPSANGISRDAVMQRMHEAGIGTGIHYNSLHLHQFYRERYGYAPSDYPNALWVSERTLSLPLSAKMSMSDAEDVVGALHWALYSA